MIRLTGVAVCAALFIFLPLQKGLGQDDSEPSWAISGTGGVHLRVEPGELDIRLFKRDLNVRRAQGRRLQATLFSPDRKRLDRVEIPAFEGDLDDRRAPVQKARLQVEVDRGGFYMLQIATLGDRHGVNVEWAIDTNAAGWVIETARGHRDERHREPIVMNDPDRPADIHFLPRPDEFGIEVEGLPADAEPLRLYDADDELVAEIPLDRESSSSIRRYMRRSGADGPEASAVFTVSADERRGERPWRLHLPQAQFYLEIDGLTRWERGDLYPDQNVWSPVADSWFPFLPNRWLVSPYQRTQYAEPDGRESVNFFVHNNAPDAQRMDMSLEFPGDEWDAELSSETSPLLEPGAKVEVEVSFTGPPEGEERVAHLRATPRGNPEVTNYATLRVLGGKSPVGEPLDLPHVLRPFAHENRQYGYLPEYSVHNQVYFDLENRGFVVDGPRLYREVNGEWVTTRLREAVTRAVPEVDSKNWVAASTKVAFDSDNNVYLLGRAGRSVALLRSTDGGERFTAYVMEGREGEPRSWDIEQFSGHNVPDGPPAVVRLTRTQRDASDLPPARRAANVRWRSTNDLELFVAEEGSGGGITFHEPVRLTDVALGAAMHSGIPSMIVSRGSKIHVAWGEATDPETDQEEIPGVPAYVATYDRETRTASEPVFMSFGPPPNDGHNTPSITMDSEGYLHVVVGTHGRPFQYLRSLAPNDAHSGWTEAVRTSDHDLRQTYVGLVCDDEDALHLVFRLWRTGEEHLDGGLWAALAYQRKPKDGDWEDVRILVAPPLPEYSIYYHRLTVDHAGDLFLNYDYWSTSWFYRNEGRGPVAAGSGRAGRGWGRSVITSPDSGETWRLWSGATP